MMKFAFQPLIDRQLNALVGFEALARFDDGRSPETHFDEARRAGSLVELELQALEQILVASRDIPDGLMLTMNASGPAIDAFSKRRPVLDPRLTWGLELHELSAPEHCARARISADEIGCLLLVDDAGIGFATKDRISKLKPHIVKLERTLFTHYESSPIARSHVDVLLAAARDAGAKTLVEGIETTRHLELAQQLEFDYLQGYYFGHGIQAPQLPRVMTDLRRRLGVNIPGF